MRCVNVLLTSVGRRTYLVEYFRAALRDRGRVVGANCIGEAPGMFMVDEAVLVPPSYHADYVPTIAEICRKFEIRLLLSCHDLDVFVLSQNLRVIRETGAIPLLPDEEWGQRCLDKFECGRYLQSKGFRVPRSAVCLGDALAEIEADTLRLPVVVKARFGFGSLGLRSCRTVSELVQNWRAIRDELECGVTTRFIPCELEQCVIIQEQVMGDEFCLDVVNDLDGHFACQFALQVHSMRAGETDLVTTVDPASFADLGHRLSALARHVGPWGIDLMVDGAIPQIIDINPRFTGDYPFHQLAGANIPGALVAWATGHEPDPRWLHADVGVRGFKDLVPTRVEGPRRTSNARTLNDAASFTWMI